MSTTQTFASATERPLLQQSPRVSLARLVQVELRKLTDTRSGR